MNVLVTAQADGSLKHWHATSGKCLHARCDEPDNHLYCIDFNLDGSVLATAGRDAHVRLYDEATKSLLMVMKERGELPGHSNRIFSLKFNPLEANMLISGGWDNTLQVYDIRNKGPVAAIFGPHICGGDALDFRSDGVTVLAGSYRNDDALQLYDLRMMKCSRTYEWDGLDGGQVIMDKEKEFIASMPSSWQEKEMDDDEEHMQKFKPKTPPMLYCAMFNRKQDLIFAGGAGRNQMRVFDYDSGNLVCIISDMPRSILCMDIANTS